MFVYTLCTLSKVKHIYSYIYSYACAGLLTPIPVADTPYIKSASYIYAYYHPPKEPRISLLAVFEHISSM